MTDNITVTILNPTLTAEAIKGICQYEFKEELPFSDDKLMWNLFGRPNETAQSGVVGAWVERKYGTNSVLSAIVASEKSTGKEALAAIQKFDSGSNGVARCTSINMDNNHVTHLGAKYAKGKIGMGWYYVELVKDNELKASSLIHIIKSNSVGLRVHLSIVTLAIVQLFFI
jgi:hypothetical protein